MRSSRWKSGPSKGSARLVASVAWLHDPFLGAPSSILPSVTFGLPDEVLGTHKDRERGYLMQADRHIAECKNHIAHQREIILELVQLNTLQSLNDHGAMTRNPRRLARKTWSIETANSES